MEQRPHGADGAQEHGYRCDLDWSWITYLGPTTAAGGEPISRDQFTITGHAVVRRLKLSLSMGKSLDARADNAAQNRTAHRKWMRRADSSNEHLAMMAAPACGPLLP